MVQPETLYGPDASILVTGASSGLGAALAVRLARHGGKVALMARRPDRLEQVAGQVRAAGARALELVGDVSDAGQVRAAAARVEGEHGAVTVAFLNAGVGAPTPLRRFSAAEVRRIFDINVMGVAHWLEQLLPSMIERRAGVVAGISSLAAHRGLSTTGGYGSSKAALSHLLEALRLEANECGVQISIVEPGFIRTEMTAKNRFAMPFIVGADSAAQTICAAVAGGQGLIRFPWPTSVAMRLIKGIPASVFERLAPLVGPGRGHSRRSV